MSSGLPAERGRIAALVVSYEAREHLAACLRSLRAAAVPVTVVDNASDDGSVALVRRDYPEMQIVARASNVGYGAAANETIPGLDAAYVLLLNPDTVVAAEAPAALAAYLDAHPRVGVVGPRLLNADGSLQPSCYPRWGPLALFLQESGLEHAVVRVPWLGARYVRGWAHDRARAVPWVLGAALGIRRSAFIDVDGFDASFFLYHEEVDLCERMRDAGWEVHFSPDAVVVHVGGASTGRDPSASAARYHETALRYAAKHLPRRSRIAVRGAFVVVFAGRLVRDGVRRFLTPHGRRRDALDTRLGVTWAGLRRVTSRGPDVDGRR
jgi:GT2 family glycosyltransferase